MENETVEATEENKEGGTEQSETNPVEEKVDDSTEGEEKVEGGEDSEGNA